MSHDTPLPLDTDDPNEILKAFAANPAFRAADWDELTTEDNPYRRPVRPDDLAWLDYSRPMPAEEALKLSGLLGHRMLRNVYDLEALYLPPADLETVTSDQDAFYCDRNRTLSALAKPVLENHLFTFLDQQRRPLDRLDPAGLAQYVVEYFQQRQAEPGKAFGAVLDTQNTSEAATFLLLQASAFIPAANTALGRGALGEYDLAHAGLRPLLLEEYRSWVSAAPAYNTMLAGTGLKPAAAAYWQLYLNSSLARGNHFHYLSVNREEVFALLGALTHKKIDDAVTRARYAQIFSEHLDADTAYFDGVDEVTEQGLRELVDRLVSPLAGTFGTRAVESFHRGFADAAWFAELWDADLAQQVTWADRIPEYQEKAEKIWKHLVDEKIEVDLDTFVESWEETSTTHVHDEHRLVMIEAGQMHFWNNITHKVELHDGDKLFIPETRLHGSTVLSGECTYHQPIIPDDLLRKIL